ncbi:DUF4402 domain-containing protein [Erythrobacter aquimaris]|uniref:DUF4402 domain-containing protein n=1 Tax=Qipengyuania aquimaris TaxID=255984 RepID=A0A6I4TFB8_9SPHN|nr:DUF4402 domain-containing protein [Qipengyuania aquimaris]MXO94802.1 DUF4402 domain-containing protein [Qipengyuania aquimaris]
MSDAATAGGQAITTVVDPINVVAQRQLDFGQFEAGSNRSVTVLPNDLVQDSGKRSARFAIRGANDRKYSIALQAQVTARGDQSGTALQVNNITVKSLNSGATDWTGNLDAIGEDSVFVGGTIQTSEHTPADRYRAEITLHVTYN